jgi:glycosyltransferase involved in cell wall biosynthesis
MKKKIFILPVPPPYAGPELMANTLVESSTIKDNNSIIHINGNINTRNAMRGTFTKTGFLNFIKILYYYMIFLIGASSVFLYFSSSKLGFLKDSIYMLLGWFLGKKVFAQYHGSHFIEFYNNNKTLYKKYIIFVLNRLTRVLTLGESIKTDFKKIICEESISVLPNGLNSKVYREVKVKKNDTFTIFFMGHLWYPKGFYDLLYTYKRLYKQYGNRIAFKFAGENVGYLESALEFLSEPYAGNFKINGRQMDKEIQDFINNADKYNAEHLGFIEGEEKIKHLKNASVFVLPSYTEGFSMAVLESMAAGLPVIVTPVGAMPEVVEHSKNGLITPIANQDELEKNIEFFIEHPEKCLEMGLYNAEYVKKKYDVEIVASQLLSIIQNA